MRSCERLCPSPTHGITIDLATIRGASFEKLFFGVQPLPLGCSTEPKPQLGRGDTALPPTDLLHMSAHIPVLFMPGGEE